MFLPIKEISTSRKQIKRDKEELVKEQSSSFQKFFQIRDVMYYYYYIMFRFRIFKILYVCEREKEGESILEAFGRQNLFVFFEELHRELIQYFKEPSTQLEFIPIQVRFEKVFHTRLDRSQFTFERSHSDRF